MDNFKFFLKNQSNFESCKTYFFEKSLNIGKLEDTKINTFEKFQKFVEKRINETEIKRENTFITVISNPKILYQMGKICAKSSFKLEMGLLCLSDYIKFLKFNKNYDESSSCYKKSMAKFFQGVIFCLLKQYKNADNCFKKSKMNEHLQRKPIRNDFKNLFLEFYRIFLVREIEFVFDINKLKDL